MASIPQHISFFLFPKKLQCKQIKSSSLILKPHPNLTFSFLIIFIWEAHLSSFCVYIFSFYKSAPSYLRPSIPKLSSNLFSWHMLIFHHCFNLFASTALWYLAHPSWFPCWQSNFSKLSITFCAFHAHIICPYIVSWKRLNSHLAGWDLTDAINAIT